MKRYKLLLLALTLVAVGLTTAILMLVFQSGLLGPPEIIAPSEMAEGPYPLPGAEQPPEGSTPLEEVDFLPGVVVPGACTVDLDGANDVPDQTDLSQMCLFRGLPALDISWSWDDISGTGSNTLDGCALFDNNGNGQVDYALCVRLMPDPNQNNRLMYYETALYACADKKPDRCSAPMVQLVPSAGTTCSANQASTDPFDASALNGPGDDFPDDTTAICTIAQNDVGGPGTVYINTCSFPSGQSNSNPFDCLATLDGGFLTVEKVATPNDPAVGFSFLISNTVTTIFTPTIYGSGTSPRYSVIVGSYAVEEIIPAGWQLTGAGCVDQNGQPAGGGINPVTGILISSGKDVVCTVIDAALPTATPTATSTATATLTATATSTSTATATPTATTTSTSTAMATETATATSTAPATETATATSPAPATETATATSTAPATETATATSTAPATETATATSTAPATETATATSTAMATSTATATATSTTMATSTATATITSTATHTATATMTATSTSTSTNLPTAPSTATQTATRTATATSTATKTAGPPPSITPTRERPGGGSNNGVVGFSVLFGGLVLAGMAGLMLGMYRRVKGTR